MYMCYVVICRSTNNSVEVFIKVGSYFALSDEEPKCYYQKRHLPSFVLERNKYAILNLVDYIGAKFITIHDLVAFFA
jgi:hypothetical protein